jgi:hypothetical protein
MQTWLNARRLDTPLHAQLAQTVAYTVVGTKNNNECVECRRERCGGRRRQRAQQRGASNGVHMCACALTAARVAADGVQTHMQAERRTVRPSGSPTAATCV